MASNMSSSDELSKKFEEWSRRNRKTMFLQCNALIQKGLNENNIMDFFNSLYLDVKNIGEYIDLVSKLEKLPDRSSFHPNELAIRKQITAGLLSEIIPICLEKNWLRLLNARINARITQIKGNEEREVLELLDVSEKLVWMAEVLGLNPVLLTSAFMLIQQQYSKVPASQNVLADIMLNMIKDYSETMNMMLIIRTETITKLLPIADAFKAAQTASIPSKTQTVQVASQAKGAPTERKGAHESKESKREASVVTAAISSQKELDRKALFENDCKVLSIAIVRKLEIETKQSLEKMLKKGKPLEKIVRELRMERDSILDNLKSNMIITGLIEEIFPDIGLKALKFEDLNIGEKNKLVEALKNPLTTLAQKLDKEANQFEKQIQQQPKKAESKEQERQKEQKGVKEPPAKAQVKETPKAAAKEPQKVVARDTAKATIHVPAKPTIAVKAPPIETKPTAAKPLFITTKPATAGNLAAAGKPTSAEKPPPREPAAKAAAATTVAKPPVVKPQAQNQNVKPVPTAAANSSVVPAKQTAKPDATVKPEPKKALDMWERKKAETKAEAEATRQGKPNPTSTGGSDSQRKKLQ